LNEYFLFSDCSFDPASKKCVGACVYFDHSLIAEKLSVAEAISSLIKTFSVDCTSCAQGELLSMIFALNHFEKNSSKFLNGTSQKVKPILSLFTDSKTLAELPKRRAKLEANAFRSLRTKALLSNAHQYQDIYTIIDRLELNYQVSIHWVKGHTQAGHRSFNEEVLAVVDKAARNALREIMIR
jgi:ribonuclease HI